MSHVSCLAALRRCPPACSAPALRRKIATELHCSPFSVRLLSARYAGPGLLMQVGVPTQVVASRPRSRPALYLRQLPSDFDDAQRQLFLSTLTSAVSRLFDEDADARRRRVFIGRPLIVAADRTPAFVKIYRFTRTHWNIFSLSRPTEREWSYRRHLVAQSILADLIRLFGRQVRLEFGRGFEVVLGDASAG